MDIKNIKALVSIMNSSDLSLLEISEGDTKIVLKKAESSAVPAISEVKKPATYQKEQTILNDTTEELVDFNNITEVKAPLVGVFYSAASPDSAPFVTIGSHVKKGDVLCIVEAMKLMNEITAESDGEVVDICAKNGDIVEFGQTLFKIY